MERGVRWRLQTLSALVAVLVVLLSSLPTPRASDTVEELRPTVLIAVPVRNKAHTLPYFLWYLEKLDYPKDRISLWFRSDHNSDNSSAQLKAWLDRVSPLYHSVDVQYDDTETKFPGQEMLLHWSHDRFSHVMQLRQQALDAGRNMWADYVLMTDADVIIQNPKTLQLLVEQDKTIVAPLMNVTTSDNYANFWGEMDDEGYYKRSSNYFDVKERVIKGCFEVAMVHSILLISLRHGISQRLAYTPAPQNYHGPYDDIIIFAHSAKFNGVKMHLLNTEFFGYVPLPMEAHNTVAEEAEQFAHIKTESIVDDVPLERVDYLYPPPLTPVKDKLGFDQVYMINLKRRPDRMEKMLKCFDELGIDFQYVEAVDGKLLNDSYLEAMKVRMLPGYADPYHGRPLTKGEIGCFLSHYFIWLDIIENGYERVLVFEDDIRFEPYFRRRLGYIMEEVRQLRLDWDLIYLGRRRMKPKFEKYVRNTKMFVHPDYSLWALGYLLTNRGANKLAGTDMGANKMAATDRGANKLATTNRGANKMATTDPLSHLMALDEYFSVMFNKHPSYLGRKKLRWQDEEYVEGSERLVFPHYSYWTLSYLLTRSGVDKLLSHEPLNNLLPIDEYIPILFDKHIEDDWKNQFSPRDLKGFSVEPLLVYPTRYTGEPGYVTDTDNSEVINFGDDGFIEKTTKQHEAKDPPGSPLKPTLPGQGHRGDIEDLPKPKDEL